VKTIKAYKFDSLLKDELKNKSFKKEFDLLDEEFALAKEIINLRKKNNITQKELAKRIGSSQPAIARIESGNYHNVSLAFLRKLANALGAVPQIHFKVSR
jgi:DNA-binding XRE family transcriptional regulator